MAYWVSFLQRMASSSVFTRAGLTVIGAGTYIFYQDSMRYPRMMKSFASGKLLGPVIENQYEIAYFNRPIVETRLRNVLRNNFTNQYYLVRGEIGSGKSRMLVEIVRDMVNTCGALQEGAPVYVLASQGSSFADTLAKAVNFHFDEHINFKFALSMLLRVQSLPSKIEEHKLKRVLDAIEEAAFRYMVKNGRPIVLVIDDAGWIQRHGKCALSQLQVKAKLWADTNVAKIIFVTNNEDVEIQFQEDQSCWSRCDTPVYITDLTDEEAKKFLKRRQFYEQEAQNRTNDGMTNEYCAEIVKAIGGRVQHLIQCRRDWEDGLDVRDAIARLTSKAREKLLGIGRSENLMNALANLTPENNYSLRMVDMMRRCPIEDIHTLTKLDVVTLVRNQKGIIVKMESRALLRAYTDLQSEEHEQNL